MNRQVTGHISVPDSKFCDAVLESPEASWKTLFCTCHDSCCPFCQAMFEDGGKGAEFEDKLKSHDITEIKAERIEEKFTTIYRGKQ